MKIENKKTNRIVLLTKHIQLVMLEFGIYLHTQSRKIEEFKGAKK